MTFRHALHLSAGQFDRLDKAEHERVQLGTKADTGPGTLWPALGLGFLPTWIQHGR